MKFLVLLFGAFFLVGCTTTVPVSINFPTAPNVLMRPCVELKRINDGAVLSEVAKIVSENYMLYHECALKSESWTNWYNAQKNASELK